jgi:hypothetical protein
MEDCGGGFIFYNHNGQFVKGGSAVVLYYSLAFRHGIPSTVDKTVF